MDWGATRLSVPGPFFRTRRFYDSRRSPCKDADEKRASSYYLLLQIGFVLVQLLERGNLLRRLAAELGRPFWKLYGSLKNVARRLLDSVRDVAWEEEWFDAEQARRLRIGLDSS